jgi:hypothetical protein
MVKCPICHGKRYLIATRDDGRQAIERCDECQWFGENDPRNKSDEDAAQWARADGIKCGTTYPCYLVK